MAYEIDFIGVSSDKSAKDADAICLRWKDTISHNGTQLYKVGIVDAGFEAHGNAMVEHMNHYYFGDREGVKNQEEKIVDFVVVTHPDRDHVNGIKIILDNFNVQKIYMNRPWLYVDELFDKVNDGRITRDSLVCRLRNKYQVISDIEDIAEKKSIPILEAFQGTSIESEVLILAPPKQFYFDMLVESEKTPLEENQMANQEGMFAKFAMRAEKFALNILEAWDIETLRKNVKTTAENETSVVIRGKVGDSGFFLTGDAGLRALNKAMDYLDMIGEDILSSVSFYQIPHHGGRHNVSPSLLDRMLGKKVTKGTLGNKTAFASVAQNSDHPLRMVTNAYIRRGVKVYKTQGKVICHHNGDMPERNWSALEAIDFFEHVEEWDE